jgi:hypothetical protein
VWRKEQALRWRATSVPAGRCLAEDRGFEPLRGFPQHAFQCLLACVRTRSARYMLLLTGPPRHAVNVAGRGRTRLGMRLRARRWVTEITALVASSGLP